MLRSPRPNRMGGLRDSTEAQQAEFQPSMLVILAIFPLPSEKVE